MKSNRIMWGLVSLVVLITIAVSLGTMSSHSQQDTSKKQDNKQDNNGFEDLSKYAVTDYNAPESDNATEREKRILKNKRYDNQDWVIKNPHPDTDGVGLIDEVPSLPAIPTAESNLVIIGEIINANAYLSNDKKGVYSEYTVLVEETIKEGGSYKVASGDSITVDRAGGYVRYPNGQKVLYTVSQEDLPRVGSHYLLFLSTDKQSPNYRILTGYESKDGKVNPLDTGRRFDDFKGFRKMDFIKAIRTKISESSHPVKN